MNLGEIDSHSSSVIDHRFAGLITPKMSFRDSMIELFVGTTPLVFADLEFLSKSKSVVVYALVQKYDRPKFVSTVRFAAQTCPNVTKFRDPFRPWLPTPIKTQSFGHVTIEFGHPQHGFDLHVAPMRLVDGRFEYMGRGWSHVKPSFE